MQSAEDRSDRQVTGAVRGRIDWRYTPGLERQDPGFNSSFGPPTRLTTRSLHLSLDGGFSPKFNTC